ncbi:hypothetical protein ON010_g13849 [Phytophthora cinnamomi]|nr:hypothetical protein ON010_g13849 [Phytophthora cinnamomi]
MDNSVLHPPGRHRWSDRVIGEVVQRSPPLSRGTVATGSTGSFAAWNTRETRFVISADRLDATNTTQPAEPAAIPAIGQELTPSTTAVDAGLALRRQRRRVNMARYRKKQSDHAVKLGREVQVLRDEVKKLTLQYTSIAAQVATETTSWNVAAEYFRLFRRGSQTLEPTSPARVYSPSVQVQRDFLQATMAPDMPFGAACGVEAHLEIWRLCALCHQDFDIRLGRLECLDENSLVATTTCTVVITIDTLHYAFPHLVQRDQSGNWSPLVTHLLGQTLVVHGSTRLTWDKEKKCMVSVDYTADMLTPLLSLLGSLENVSYVFDNALVTTEGKFVAVE